MTDSVLFSFMGVATLVIINIALAAYSYGKLSQRVSDLSRRVNRIEVRMNGRYPYTHKEEE